MKKHLLRSVLAAFALLLVCGNVWATDYFEKVTSAPTSWEGDYLIVYETGNVAFDGSLETLDAVSNTQPVTISNGKIEATDAMKAIKFTVAFKSESSTVYNLKSASGSYISGTTATSNASNGLKQDAVDTNYEITFGYSDGKVSVYSKSKDQNMTLKFNKATNQTRFRFYKSGQEDIALYKLASSGGVTPPATVDVTGVTLDKESASVEAGEKVTLAASVAPANATNKAVTWSSDNESKATVADGVVTGVAAGKANITVTTVDGGFTATCVVTVTEPVIESEYATTYTSNIEYSGEDGSDASDAKVVIAGTEYPALKAGTGKQAGTAEITVPKGATKLHFHAAGWNGAEVTMVVKNGVTELLSQKLTSDTGVAGNSPFTLAGNAYKYYYSVDVADLTTDAPVTLSFVATAGNRFVLFGVNAEGDFTPIVSAPTISPKGCTFEVSQEVTIECATEGATISYSLDEGATWATYTEPFTVTTTTTVMAKATKAGMWESKVKSVTYTKASTSDLTTMDEIFTKATEVGSTATACTVTFNNWVVSGVNSGNVYVTDGTKGFIIYASNHGFEVGDVLSGTVAAKIQKYNGSAEFKEVTSETEGLTVTKGGTVTAATVSIAELSGANTGALVTVSAVTYNASSKVLSDGTNTITPYKSLYADMAFTDGGKYNVTGVYLQYNSTKEILPRSAADIEEIIATLTGITVSGYSTSYQQYDVFTFDGTVTANYSDNTTADVTTKVTVDTPDMTTTGQKTVKVTYTEEDVTKTFSYTITVAGVNATPGTYTFGDDWNAEFGTDKDGAFSPTANSLTLTAKKNVVSLTATNGSSLNGYIKTGDFRIYKNYTMTLAVPQGYYIKKIVFTKGGKTVVNMEPNVGHYSVTNGVGTWQGVAQSVVFTPSDACGFSSIAVTFGELATNDTRDGVYDTASELYYATFCPSDNYTVDENTSIYTVTVEDGKAVLNSLGTETVIPAGAAVLLCSLDEEMVLRPTVEEPADYDFYFDTDYNQLIGFDEDTEITGSNKVKYYALNYKTVDNGKQVGFFAPKGAGTPNGSFTAKANKAYLKVKDQTAANSLDIRFGGTTMVEQMLMNSENTVIYDLLGRKVENATKGIYIVNGKKVCIK